MRTPARALRRGVGRAAALLAAAVVLVLGAAAPLRAQGALPSATSNALPNGPDAYDQDEYQRVIDQALQEFQRGNWDEAEGLFVQAHRIHPNARTFRGIGIAAFEARRYVRALEQLRAALRSSVNPLTDDQRVEVERAVERAERYVATVELELEPATADVRVNGEPLAQSGSLRVARVDPGLVQVQASAPAYASSARELRVAAGEHSKLVLRLVPERADAAPSSASSQAPAQGMPVASSASPAPSPEPEPAGPQFHAWKWIVLGVGGLALIGGGAAHLKRELTTSEHNADDACLVREAGQELPKRCHQYEEDVDEAEVLMAVGYGAGALFVGVAALMFALEGSSDGPPARADGCQVEVGAMRCMVHF